MRAEPIGLQEGLGILGFCYVQYHFVYDLYYPVLVQIYDGRELFQFPLVVVIDKNKPREGEEGAIGLANPVPELCQNMNQEIRIETYNNNLEPVESVIRFKCLDTSCYIGSTVNDRNGAVLETKIPSCINGFIYASSEGYTESKYQVKS